MASSPDAQSAVDAVVAIDASSVNPPAPNGHADHGEGAATETEGANPELDESGFQHTVVGPAVIEGRGIFLGEAVTCTILPAPPDTGIVFERIDLESPVRIPAIVTNVAPRARRTAIRAGEGSVETIEHLMAALAGLRVDNALIQVTGPEIPGCDGSARPFVDAIRKAGLVRQEANRRYFKVTEPITVEEGESMLAALPSEQPGLQILYDLDHGPDHRLARQVHACRLNQIDFAEDLAPARTFALAEEAQALWDRGLCQHLTPKDVLVIGEDGPIENEYRFDNEPVRHKVLDLVGDLYLLGRPVQGRIVAARSGHALNHRLVGKLLQQLRAQQRTDTASRRGTMDIRAIMKLMRHRYPMLLIDRVIELDGDQRAVGIKNVTINEPFFAGHYPGTPIMPGVLIVEAMAQLSGLLVSRVLEHTGKIAILLSLDKVKLRRPVVPGDQLVMEAETIRARSRTANVKCKAYVGGQVAAEALIKFLMVDADDQDPE